MIGELYHYGVKGMKWGVRRYQNYDGTRIKKTAAITISPTGYALYKGIKKIQKSRNEKFANSDYSKAKKMSDAELRDHVNRINLEQSYIKAMEQDRQSSKQAKQWVFEKYASEPVKYIVGIPNNKEFKKVVAKKTAKVVWG